MGEEKKVKYYHIRASVMWLVLVLIGILFLIGIFTTSRITVLCASHEETENARVETMHMEYGQIKSKLKNCIVECSKYGRIIVYPHVQEL